MTRTPNLNPEIVKEIARSVGLRFVPEQTGEQRDIRPRRFAGLYLCRATQPQLPREIQRVPQDRLSASAIPHRQGEILAVGQARRRDTSIAPTGESTRGGAHHILPTERRQSHHA